MRLLHMIAPSGQGTKHVTSARWVLAHADAGCDSAGESRLLYLLAQSGLQGLETQYPVFASNKWYFIDVAIPEHRIGIEAEERRQRLLEAQGWRIRRFRWEALAHPEEVVAQIRALLEHS